MAKSRLSRKAKIRRVKRRRSELRVRNHDIVGLINRGGAGVHAGQSKRDLEEKKAPKVSDWN